MLRHPREEWATYDQQAGPDGQWLLKRLAEADVPTVFPTLSEVQVLTPGWAPQFQETGEKVAYQAGATYDEHTQIRTTHDPDARYSKKRGHEWVGGNVQGTETDDEGQPHLITDLAGSCSRHTDCTARPEIQARLQERHGLPAQQYADHGYLSAPTLAQRAAQEINLMGPVFSVISRQSKIPNGITPDQFDSDVAKGPTVCPAGDAALPDWGWAGKVRFRFPEAVCAACALRPRCGTSQGGQTLCGGTTYPLLQAARQRQTTQLFKADYYQHRSGVEGGLSRVVRGHGLRVLC
jgi:transposase